MAETFEALRVGAGGFEQRVCLKRVLPAFSEDESLLARFRREAMLAAKLRHTNIVGVVDAGAVNGSDYIALELVDGVDLRSFLKLRSDQKLSADLVTLIAMDLAYALEHAHGTLVHRDVSPPNILLSRSGEAKLADFGVAKAIDATNATVSQAAKGKIPYMAPEHIRGEAVDGRADLFSLGVVMFEALAGTRPFDGAHDVETMRKILDGDRLRLAEVAPGVPETLSAIVDRLLAIERNHRTQNASQLLDELAAIAPAPSVRLTLATAIEDLRGGPEARLHVRAKDEERDTELTQLPKAVQPRGTPKPVGRSRASWLAAAIVAAVIGFGAIAMLNANEPPRIEAANAGAGADVGASADVGAGADTGAGAVADAVAGTDTDTDTDAVADPAPPVAARPPRKGWLTVVVQPWGNVWIDGKYFGRAPVRARLDKGRHVIAAGHELPRQKRVVRVQPGARKEIELTLAEP